MNRSARLYLIVAAAVVVLLGAGVYVTVQLVGSAVNGSVPQANLLGSDTPTTPAAPATTAPGPTPTPTVQPGADIKGPLNVLIVGVDTRTYVKNWVPHSDAVMIMHVNADLTKAYLTSLPRDLVVNIPAFQPAGFSGARSKLTHAMAFGSRVPGTAARNAAQGMQLLAKTIENYTGIDHFDAGLLLNFQGLRNLVDDVGGLDFYVDSKIVSIHMAPNGQPRTSCATCAHGYSGPAATYNVGMQHIVGWQALDIARQRYVAGGDYTRQRHQRQIIEALIGKIASTDIMTNPVSLARLVGDLAERLIFDGRGHQPIEWMYAMRNIRPSTTTVVGLPGSGAYIGGNYQGENLNSIEAPFFVALRQDTLDSFLAAHKSLVNAPTS